MRSVLFLAPYFPPIGGAGVQRNVQLARHLPSHGYSVTVITGPGAPDYRWTPSDRSLAELGEDVPVIRLPAPEPRHGARWEGRAERWLRVPTRWERWWASNALDCAARLPAKVDVVQASLRPYSTAATAITVARRLEAPLVVDLEDPWALDEMWVYPTGIHRTLDVRRMSRVLAQANAVVMNTEEAARRVVQAFPGLGATVRAIPNAFDPHAFEKPRPSRNDSRFRVVHTGSLHSDQGLAHRRRSRLRRALGGAVDGVDFLTRSHVFLLQAIERVLERRPELQGTIEVQFAGVLTSGEQMTLEAYPYVRVLGFLPHDETIALIRSADLLFLPMHDLPPGRRATIVPHKTYEYIASGRPILAAVPSGDAHDLLAASGTADLCRPADVAAMAHAIEARIERWQRREQPSDPDPDVVTRCAAPRLAAQVAGVYDELLTTRAV